MEILYLISGVIALILIWIFVSAYLDKKKQNKKKLSEYPQILKELKTEKSNSAKLQNNFERETLKNKRLSNEIVIKNQVIKDIEQQIILKSEKSKDISKSLNNAQNELELTLKENEKTLTQLQEQVSENISLKSDLNSLEKNYLSSNKSLSDAIRERDNFKNGLKEQHELFLAIKDKSQNSVSKITSMYSDFLLLEYDVIARRLENKSRPAISESKRIKELKIQSKFHLEQSRQILYKYEYLLNIFPELSNYVDDFDTLKKLDDANSLDDFKEDFDNVQNYLSKEEYLALDEDVRNQLALDRYLNGRKTNWQIGRDYELFCGLEYEKMGWEVEYFGMEKKLNDLGRYLIVRKGNKVEIIQCKLWKKTKTIHEKHILQLYGTTIIDTLINPDLFNKVSPVFITNTKLSETAIKFANILGVRIEKWEMQDFPRIKCNIGVDEFGLTTKIYHLPFDQHYDRTKIKWNKGFMAMNVEEATSKGFRRSYKYYGR